MSDRPAWYEDTSTIYRPHCLSPGTRTVLPSLALLYKPPSLKFVPQQPGCAVTTSRLLRILFSSAINNWKLAIKAELSAVDRCSFVTRREPAINARIFRKCYVPKNFDYKIGIFYAYLPHEKSLKEACGGEIWVTIQ